MDPGAGCAVEAADAAALAAGVVVRELNDLADLAEVINVFEAVWGAAETPPLNIELLRALIKAGNYVSGAWAGGRLLGACVGFFHAPAEDALHSHIAGVSRDVTGRSVGFALKLHQRAWVLLRGVSQITWTVDPLVSRNAYFNLVKLGARPIEYLPNFYGAMVDPINRDDDSDRLLMRWALRDPGVVAACSGAPVPARVADEVTAGAVVALGVGADGGPESGRLDGSTGLVALPPDIETLRVTQPALAQRWRVAVREVLTGLMADGGRITGFDKSGWYVVRRDS